MLYIYIERIIYIYNIHNVLYIYIIYIIYSIYKKLRSSNVGRAPYTDIRRRMST